MDVPDDGVSDDHSVASHLPERSEAVPGGDLEDRRGGSRRQRPGSLLPLLQGPWFPGAGVKDIWEDHVLGARGLCRETHGVEVVRVLAACCILTPDLWASARDVSMLHKSAIKASNSETMVNVCK